VPRLDDRTFTREPRIALDDIRVATHPADPRAVDSQRSERVGLTPVLQA
jgi:hypothetical protein